jgi:hypothetical protein
LGTGMGAPYTATRPGNSNCDAGTRSSGRLLFRRVRVWHARPVRMGMLLPSGSSPALAVFANPIEERTFEPNIVTKAFRFQPLVFQDLFSFGEEFLIQAGLFHELAGSRGLLSWVSHEARNKREQRVAGCQCPLFLRNVTKSAGTVVSRGPAGFRRSLEKHLQRRSAVNRPQ